MSAMCAQAQNLFALLDAWGREDESITIQNFP